jgi:KEOPS complex subunit Cgi121
LDSRVAAEEENVLKCLREFDKYLDITGFRNVKVDTAESFLEEAKKKKPLEAVVQFFDADVIATWQHPYFATINALTAFRNGENISRNLSMEIMLYTSARRQIRKATELVGIKPESCNVAVLTVESDAKAAERVMEEVAAVISRVRDDSVLELSKEKIHKVRRVFDISDVEIEAVNDGNVERAIVDLVIERVSLLATQR